MQYIEISELLSSLYHLVYLLEFTSLAVPAKPSRVISILVFDGGFKGSQEYGLNWVIGFSFTSEPRELTYEFLNWGSKHIKEHISSVFDF